MKIVDLGYISEIRAARIQESSLDSRSVKGFREKVKPYEEAHLVLDLSEITFMDSSGLGSLLGLHRRLSEQGHDLRLAGLTKPVRNLFELVRIHRIFDIYPTLEEAASSYGNRKNIGRQ